MLLLLVSETVHLEEGGWSLPILLVYRAWWWQPNWQVRVLLEKRLHPMQGYMRRRRKHVDAVTLTTLKVNAFFNIRHDEI